jgi:hypothetical protein
LSVLTVIDERMAGSLNVLLLGATGLVGKRFLQEAENTNAFESVISLGRRSAGIKLKKATEHLIPDSETWANEISGLKETPDIMISSIGTTKGAAGSFEAQYKIDHGLTLATATAARQKGVHTFVLVSAMGASKNSFFAYMKMKGEIEDDIIALKFPHTIILRPGLLLGDRQESRPMEAVARRLGNCTYGTPLRALMNPIHDLEVAKAGINLSLEKKGSTSEPVVEIIGNAELISLAKE